ncbi:MAG: FeoA domain-containing protein [Pirellulales bacterium]
MKRTAADMRVGERAVVAEVMGYDEVTARLMEMGLIPGVALELVGVAPLGDPLEFQLPGYRLSMRRTEAQRAVLRSDGEGGAG